MRRAKSPSGEASFRRGFHVGQCDCFIFRAVTATPSDRYDVILGGFVDFGNIIDVCDLVDISNLVDVRDVVLAIGGRKALAPAAAVARPRRSSARSRPPSTE